MTGQRKYWKSYAKSNLKGTWGIAIAAMLAVVAVNFIGNIFAVQLFPGDSVFALVLSEIFVFIVSLIGMIFSTGYSYMQLNICRGRDYSLSDLLYMFHNQPDRVLVAGLVVALIDTVVQIPFYYVTYMVNPGETVESMIHWYQLLLGAWLLAMVLSVIFTVPFALTFYLLADNPDMGGMEALKESARLMKKHILKYWIMMLSFVPLLILSLFTMYIALLWAIPYMYMTEAVFYMDIQGELQEESVQRENIQEEEPRRTDDYNSEA